MQYLINSDGIKSWYGSGAMETDIIVIGGGVAGMTTAIELAGSGNRVVIVEKGQGLGGRLAAISHAFPTMASGKELSAALIGRIEALSASGKMSYMTCSFVEKVSKESGRFASSIRTQNGNETVLSKAVVIATGLEPIDATVIPEFGLGRFPDVITSLQLEEMLSSGDGVKRPSDGKAPRTVSFIQCVGSRVERRGVRYCSNICCLNAIKNASLIRDLLPEARSFILYIDIRSHGKGYEDAYKEARRKGVTFIRGQPSLVIEKNGRLLVCGENTLLKELYEIDSELVVLSVGLRTGEGNQMMFASSGIETNMDGLPACSNELMSAERAKVDGIFFAGSAEAPKDIRDTITHSKACALEIINFLNE